SDRRLLEQMIRNLISNALKYTQSGRVLVGCRRRQGKLRIEIWDTGIGIPESELQAIFEEYHQVDNAARQRSQGLGLGLSIVKSLGELLGHPIRVRSLRGKGSVFSIEVPLTPGGVPSPPDRRSPRRAAEHRTDDGVIAGAFGTGHRSPPAGRGAKHRSSGPDGSLSQDAGRADPGARQRDAAHGGQDCERPEEGDRVAEDAGEPISAAASRGSDGRL